MIVDRELTEDEKRKSRLCYTLANGFGSTAASFGTSILVLAGVELSINSTVLSAFGAFNYVSYIAIPLGIVIGRKIGAGQSMLWGKVGITLMCLLFAAAGYIPKSIAHPLFIAEMAVFFLCNSVSMALLWPIQSCITNSKNLARFLSVNNIVISVTSVICTVLVAWYFKFFSGYSAFAFLFLLSGFFFIFNGLFFGIMVEPVSIKRQSAKPILPQVKEAWKNVDMKRQFAASFGSNLVASMFIPVCALAARRGYDMSNTQVMILTLIQTSSTIVGAWIFPALVRKLGTTNFLLINVLLLAFLASCWLCIPCNAGIAALAVPFAICGFSGNVMASALNMVFIGTIRPSEQLGGVLIIFIATGMFPGLLAIFCNPILFAILEKIPADTPVELYRRFFLILLLLLPALWMAVRKLPRG